MYGTDCKRTSSYQERCVFLLNLFHGMSHLTQLLQATMLENSFYNVGDKGEIMCKLL